MDILYISRDIFQWCLAIYIYKTYTVVIWFSDFLKQLGNIAFSKCWSNGSKSFIFRGLFSAVINNPLVTVYDSRTIYGIWREINGSAHICGNEGPCPLMQHGDLLMFPFNHFWQLYRAVVKRSKLHQPLASQAIADPVGFHGIRW